MRKPLNGRVDTFSGPDSTATIVAAAESLDRPQENGECN